MQRGSNPGVGLAIGACALPVPSCTELPDVIEGIYKDHYRDLYVYLLLSGCDPADAEEFLQEGFLRLLRLFQNGKSVTNAKHWLIRVVHNIRFDERQRNSRFVTLGANDLDECFSRVAQPRLSPEAAVLESERMKQLRDAMSRLTDRQCQYLLLRAEGMKLKEIAQLFGVSTASVAETCGRAMEKLGKATT